MRWITFALTSCLTASTGLGQIFGDLNPLNAHDTLDICRAARATRLNEGQPIIDQAMFTALGATHFEGFNINGPSLIRIPDWIDPQDRIDPSAVYYLYFAHHRGNYIRLAWAADLEGPWHLHRVGAGVAIGSRGVLDLGLADRIDLDHGLAIFDHIASPEVLADDANQRIVMYFHGPTLHNGVDMGQKTFVAVSEDGLTFGDGIVPVILGNFYFRVFQFRGELYAISNEGEMHQALDPGDPWSAPPGFDHAHDLWIHRLDNPFQQVLDDAFTGLVLRHSALHRIGRTLYVFHTRKFDAPERILVSTIDLRDGDFGSWKPSFPPAEVLTAEPGWEGGELLPLPSARGPAPENVHQLRDPDVFQDADGQLYLLYCGRGEDAIGIAGLELVTPFPHSGDINGDGLVTTEDVFQFEACMTGPVCNLTPCDTPAYDEPCCGVMDTDGDGDVDLFDMFTELNAASASRAVIRR